jgi:hypothetical protein
LGKSLVLQMDGFRCKGRDNNKSPWVAGGSQI